MSLMSFVFLKNKKPKEWKMSVYLKELIVGGGKIKEKKFTHCELVLGVNLVRTQGVKVQRIGLNQENQIGGCL